MGRRSSRTSGAITLYIGEVARLLGVTTKAIRHYHRAGLLTEPPRTPSGYRVYSAADLVRLVRIRQLQALGLRLDEIRRTLDAPHQERDGSVRTVLTRLASTLDDQIAALQERRARLASLLADPTLDLGERSPKAPETLRWALDELGEHLQGVSPALLAQEARILGTLESVRWPGDLMARLRDAERALASRPLFYQRMLAFVEQWAALADEPPDSPRVDQFIASLKATDTLGEARLSLSASLEMSGGPAEALLAEVLRASLTPAQVRMLEALSEAFGTPAVTKETAS